MDSRLRWFGESCQGTALALAQLLLGALCLSPAAAAELSVHGFGTVSVAYVDRPSDWAYSRSVNQRTTDDDFRADLDSLAGIQLNYSVSQQLELVAQAAVSALDRNPRLADYLELAFLAYRPDANWSLRLGRLNLDAFLYSDHRDVGFAYGFIRPPVEFYARMPASLDGMDVSRYWLVGDAQWQVKAFAGTTSGGIGDRRLNLWPLYGAMVARETDGLTLRASAVRGRYDDGIRDLDALANALGGLQTLPVPSVAAEAGELAAMLAAKGTQVTYFSAGAAYDRHNWLVTGEISRASAEDNPPMSLTSGYISIGRRLGAMSAFVTQSASLRDSKAIVALDWTTPLTPISPILAQQAQQLADGAAMALTMIGPRQITTSLGTRWDVSPRIALKGQWDHVRTLRGGSALWRQGDARPARSNVFAVAADYVF